MLECVVNISEGRRLEVVELIARTAGDELLDVHVDADHNRSVLTLVGEDVARSVTAAAVLTLDLRTHTGVHPRIGVVDVVPFVALGSSTLDDALGRPRPLRRAGPPTSWACPASSTAPSARCPRCAATPSATCSPISARRSPTRRAGAIAVGARPVLVAYNLWLTRADLDQARSLAAAVRGPHVRALGLRVGDQVQVSMNLVDPSVVGPRQVYEQVAAQATVARAELVGLAPEAVLDRIDPAEWARLDLSAERTIEARLVGVGRSLD